MGHSRKSKPNNPFTVAQQVLQTHIQPGQHLTVALSGGIDSVVLLHILAQLSHTMPFSLSAVHVHHGISRNAGLWSQFCCNMCHALDVPIYVAYLQIGKESGQSLEAVAREQRYQVFSRLYGDFVVLAQHRDDQAETLMLQLLRGAGVRGLSSMPVIRKQSRQFVPQILRPLLHASRHSIETYARHHHLNWIVDESNDSIAYNRNFLRHEIFPRLSQRYPNYSATLQRASEHLSESLLLLDELAIMDSAQCLQSDKLIIDQLRSLSIPRAKNLLRYTLIKQGAALPSSVKLEDLLKQLFSVQADNHLQVRFGNTEIRCFKRLVHILIDRTTPDRTGATYPWHGESELVLPPTSGAIRFDKTTGTGLCAAKLSTDPVTVRFRQGGERFRPTCNRPRRSLKNLMQEAAMPAWNRDTLPLLFCGEQLIWVPGIGIDCEFQVKSGQPGILPVWIPDKP